MFFLKNFAFTSFIISNQSGCFPDMKSQFLKRVRNIFTSVRFLLTAYSFFFMTKSYASIQAPSEEREERQDLQMGESGHGKSVCLFEIRTIRGRFCNEKALGPSPRQSILQAVVVFSSNETGQTCVSISKNIYILVCMKPENSSGRHVKPKNVGCIPVGETAVFLPVCIGWRGTVGGCVALYPQSGGFVSMTEGFRWDAR